MRGILCNHQHLKFQILVHSTVQYVNLTFNDKMEFNALQLLEFDFPVLTSYPLWVSGTVMVEHVLKICEKDGNFDNIYL